LLFRDAAVRHISNLRPAGGRRHWQKIGIVAELKDPRRDALLRDLRGFRKAPGLPSMERLQGLNDLVDALGEGIAERAFSEIERYQREYGQDPETVIGAFFYLSGWGTGLDSVNQRRSRYVEKFHCDESTAWRRAQRGAAQLAALIRDQDEHERPAVFLAVFQSGAFFHPIVDFNLAYESWRPPIIEVDEKIVPFDFVLHPDPNHPGRFTHRVILPEYPLNLDAGPSEAMATFRVSWAMPVWPIWTLSAWVADSRISALMRTYRDRAAQVSIHWREHVPAEAQTTLLATEAPSVSTPGPGTHRL
jgi:hypothetical protein